MSTRLSVLLFRQIAPQNSRHLDYVPLVLTIGACDDGPSLLRLFVALPSLRLSCSLASWYVTSMAISSLLMISKMCCNQQCNQDCKNSSVLKVVSCLDVLFLSLQGCLTHTGDNMKQFWITIICWHNFASLFRCCNHKILQLKCLIRPTPCLQEFLLQLPSPSNNGAPHIVLCKKCHKLSNKNFITRRKRQHTLQLPLMTEIPHVESCSKRKSKHFHNTTNNKHSLHLQTSYVV